MTAAEGLFTTTAMADLFSPLMLAERVHFLGGP